ncbi:ankyrin repeat-containing domain protein [Suillus subalutaceus]|uniref:ankyrin repeat-containing domain protein n=1 Tax=Suillus subalutaceus TaxID=48586 RepID=UPI001B87C3FF|nr:ankyrin repeat-containing domain protein [Suillus subalutaceus]KAG1870599.1 ankyrin repeat-containing domain protein [Suillus subalutaceus]
MPVPARVQPEKNIWVAAGDGDLVRVRALSLSRSFRNLSNSNAATSPNAPDEFTYTPMHAAASYGQLEILAYLFSQGGDVNVTDEDGDTPLYAVENTETAQWLLDHGSTLDHQNNDGVSPIEHLREDFPEIAGYLQSRLSPSSCVMPGAVSPSRPSQHQQNIATESLTSSLMQSVHDIMQRSEADGRDPDEELRQVVGRTVLEGVIAGYEMTTDSDAAHNSEANSPNGVKRPRTDG